MTTHHKSTTIELSLNPDYVPDWGAWEAVRELLQNAVDADDLGHPMSVTYTKGGTVKISNHGADLSRDTLLLGTTTKRGIADQRGQFGEGYKLALAVLTRQGCSVVAHTPTETWTPVIEHSAAFGADVVKVRIKPAAKRRAGITFLVKGISADDWADYRQRCLFLADTDNTIDVRQGRILQGSEFTGQLYACGIHVGELPDNYAFGYDLTNIELDRDRKMASPWSIRYEVAQALRSAFTNHALDVDTITNLLSSDTGESLALKEYPGYSGDPFTVAVANRFITEHGDAAVPVVSPEAAKDAQNHGLTPVTVTPALASVIEQVVGDLQACKLRAGVRPTHVYTPDELTVDEQATRTWAFDLLSEYSTDSVEVVDFVSPAINGTYTEDGIRIARHRLDTRAGFISTLVHELAHVHGADGSSEHVQAIQRIFSTVIADRLGASQ